MSGKRKYELDQNVFENIDSEEKAYWLGFLSADGYVSGKVMGCKLSFKDKGHLEKLKLFLKTDIPLYEKTSFGGFYSPLGTCHISLIVTSHKIVSDLKFLGFDNKKTESLVFPNISPDLIQHYIRGYFDGDGSVFKISPRSYCGFSIVGKRDFLKDVLEFIPLPKHLIYKHKTVFAIQGSGSLRSKILYDYLYRDATVFMERKYLRFREYLKLN